jgi:uncharacterized surface protein with fasciclin (FAS1) repeats
MTMITRSWLGLFLLALSITFFSACDDDEMPVSEGFVEFLENNQEYSLLRDALVEADLVDAVNSLAGDLTLFAPNNTAMTAFLQANNFSNLESIPDDLLTATLLNHIVGPATLANEFQTGYYGTLNDTRETGVGTAVYVNTSSGVVINGTVNVIRPNRLTEDGIIHEIDAVILPSTLATFASSDPNFSILFDAIGRVDTDGSLTAALSDRAGSFFTVFAPTNAAFQALLDSSDDWNSLDDIDEALLRGVLLYHLVAGDRVLSSELTNGQTVPTQSGETVEIDLSGAQPQIIAAGNTATVIAADVIAENGVIHAIDAVLLPE